MSLFFSVRLGVCTRHGRLALLPYLFSGRETFLPDTLSPHPASRSAPVCVCGPICESGDVFGRDRPLPLDTAEGDILLIDTVGAYGRCMSSTYNMRDPGKEVVILDSGEIVWPPQ